MKRTTITFDEDDLEALALICKRFGVKTEAAAVRLALRLALYVFARDVARAPDKSSDTRKEEKQ